MNTIYSWQASFPIIQMGISVISMLAWLILRRIITGIVSRRAIANAFDPKRTEFIKKIAKSGATIILVIVLGLTWEISLEGLSLYIASFVTIAGVGLFATWSILSNVTAAVILFFFYPFRIGSKIKIIDGDNSIKGEVLGLSLFSVHIKQDDGFDVYYPNNLAIQKSIVELV